MAEFFRKGDKVRLLTINELRNRCYSVKNDWGGLWVIEYSGSPQVHAYLQNEIYLLGSQGEVVASGYEPFIIVNVLGYGTINIPPVCLEKVVPDLEEDVIEDVVQLMLDEDEIDIVNMLDKDEDFSMSMLSHVHHFDIDKLAMEHKNVEATPYTPTIHEDAPKDRNERLADLYRDVVLVKVRLDNILDEINELLKQERGDD